MHEPRVISSRGQCLPVSEYPTSRNSGQTSSIFSLSSSLAKKKFTSFVGMLVSDLDEERPHILAAGRKLQFYVVPIVIRTKSMIIVAKCS